MPPSNTGPLCDPASNRSAECVPFCQGEASSARASLGKNEVTVASENTEAINTANRGRRNVGARSRATGTIVVIKRPYPQARQYAIELLVIRAEMRARLD